MNGESLTPQQEKLNALKQVMPEVFAEGKVDWEKLKATLGEDINFTNERYVLNWAGKSEAFKVLQAPTTKTLVPAKEESVNFDETEHIFIEGENLEVLKVLQKSYFGKVKMIYIDPPYNTGNDSFIYPDKFSETKAAYEKRVGDKDEEGNKTSDSFKKNSKENGQYHSNWLNMMMPRLYLAKNLLKQDGVIFISIDDNEVHNLRLLMNEIFGEENFVAETVWQHSVQPKGYSGKFSIHHNYNLIYQKSENFVLKSLERTDEHNKNYSNPDNDVNGLWRTGDVRNALYRPNLIYDIKTPSGKIIAPPEKGWRWSSETVEKKINSGEIIFSDDETRIIRKIYLSNVDGRTPETIWFGKEVGTTRDASQEIKSLFEDKNYFDTPKPTELIKRISQLSVEKNDLILDFFSGSGTTAHAVMALNAADGGNRKCISVQLPEKCDEKSEAYKVGYKTIADIAKERIRRASKNIYDKSQSEIARLQAEIEVLDNEIQLENTLDTIKELQEKITSLQNQDLGFKVLKLSNSNFKQWQQITGKDPKALEEQMKLFVDPIAKNATIENMVYELLLKSGKDLNSTIEKKFPSFGGVAESRGGKKRNSKNYFNLPYNPKLKERARELRKAGNLSEVLFWNQVKNKQFKGFDFDRQKIIGNYIVDFYCTNCNVVIEIDGSSHDDKVEYDIKRDAYLKELGLAVIHIPVSDVMNTMDGVIAMLFNHPALKGTPPEEGNLKPAFFNINDNELVFLLEQANQSILDAILNLKPKKVIALDKLFKGNDQLKTNASLQMKDAGIAFKTI